MKLKLSLICTLLMFIVAITSMGVFANWNYADWNAASQYHNLGMGVSNFNWANIVAEKVYIVDAGQVTGKGNGVFTVKDYYETVLNSNATLSSSTQSYTTAKIRVYNNAKETYAFNAVKYNVENYSNDQITYRLPVLKHGDTIEPGQYMEFEVVFEYKLGTNPTKFTLDSILNFEFVPLDELPEEEEIAVSGALEQFKNIVNNIVADDSFKQLTNQMDDYANNDRANSSYIGNVSGASENDVVLLDNLFQGNLTLMIDNVETEVTILIKREDVDGNNQTGDDQGREMTIYLTTDNLKRDSFFSSGSADVYAAVFTSSNSGQEWYQIGDMYLGTATIKGYDGSWFGEGSFDTDTWKSNGKTIEQIIQSIK